MVPGTAEGSTKRLGTPRTQAARQVSAVYPNGISAVYSQLVIETRRIDEPMNCDVALTAIDSDASRISSGNFESKKHDSTR